MTFAIGQQKIRQEQKNAFPNERQRYFLIFSITVRPAI
jgi:hypothetical protein